MKGEYIKKKYNPAAYTADGGLVFDAAIQRWHSMQFTYGDHFKPTVASFAKFSMYLVFPLVAYYQMTFGPAHKEYLRMVSRGEVAYDAPARKYHWFAN